MIIRVEGKQENMSKLNPSLCAVAILLVASLACTSSSITVPTLDPDLINTTIAQTVVAALTQTAQPPVTGLGSPTPTELPTLTPTVTLSPTPIFTATPAVPQIVVTVATNCRVGPGKIYDRIGALLVGEVAEVFGMDPTGKYWYIRNPDGDGYCWVWGEYAALVGNLSSLPIYTPPPTPTPIPAFEAAYKSLDTCVGWWVDLELKNTGGVAFKSVSITLRDTVTSTILSLAADGFTDKDGCASIITKDNLNPGGAHIVSMPPFAYDPTGHKLRATITVCSEKAINGTCVSQVIEFKP
jgi:hypothetical protein